MINQTSAHLNKRAITLTRSGRRSASKIFTDDSARGHEEHVVKSRSLPEKYSDLDIFEPVQPSKSSHVHTVVQELKRNEKIKPSLQTAYPFVVLTAPAFVDRETALSQFLKEYKSKLDYVSAGKLLDKTSAKPMAVYGGSGSGKTVYMNEVMLKGPKLKAVLETDFDDKRLQTVITDSVGVGVTFNHDTPYLDFEDDLSFKLSQSVSARLFHTMFVTAERESRFNSDFYVEFLKQNHKFLALEDVVSYICSIIGKRHLVLCVDEMMAGALRGRNGLDADATSKVEDRFAEFFKEVGVVLNNVPNFFIVCSSLNLLSLQRGATQSDRIIVPITLAPLRFQSVVQLYKPNIDKWMHKKTAANVKLVFHDIGGSPKLAFLFDKVLQDRNAAAVYSYDNLLSLLILSNDEYVNQAVSLVQLNADLFRTAVLRAMVSEPAVPHDSLKLAVALSFVQLYNLDPDTMMNPIPVVSIAWLRILHYKADFGRREVFRSLGQQRAQALGHLIWGTLESFLADDMVDVVAYARAGTLYETQHANLMNIRLAAHCELIDSSSFEMSLWDFLTCNSKTDAFKSVLKLADQGLPYDSRMLRDVRPLIVGDYKIFNRKLMWPRNLAIEHVSFRSNKFVLDPNRLYCSTSQNSAGIDSFLSLRDTKAENVLIAFQDKTSDNSQSLRTLSMKLVFQTICNTVKHHSDLIGSYVDGDKFALVFRIFRGIHVPKEQSWKSYLKQALLGNESKSLILGGTGEMEDTKMRIVRYNKIVDSTMIMAADDVAVYFGPMFSGRPQFEIIKRSSQAPTSKKPSAARKSLS